MNAVGSGDCSITDPNDAYCDLSEIVFDKNTGKYIPNTLPTIFYKRFFRILFLEIC